MEEGKEVPKAERASRESLGCVPGTLPEGTRGTLLGGAQGESPEGLSGTLSAGVPGEPPGETQGEPPGETQGEPPAQATEEVPAGLALLRGGMLARVAEEALHDELAACNAAGAPHGLTLSAEQVRGLEASRFEALRAVGRVEFGRGVLRELVQAFVGSPFLQQETYAETLTEVQEQFYRLKSESEADGVTGPLSDDDLVEALRHAFDHEAGGSADALAAVSAAQLRAWVDGQHAGDYDQQTDYDAFEEGESSSHEERPRDELDRAYEAYAKRPDNRFAAGFFDSYDDLYAAGFDANSRIGGSTLS